MIGVCKMVMVGLCNVLLFNVRALFDASPTSSWPTVAQLRITLILLPVAKRSYLICYYFRLCSFRNLKKNWNKCEIYKINIANIEAKLTFCRCLYICYFKRCASDVDVNNWYNGIYE